MLSENVLSLVAVGVLWGATNPLIKRGSAGVENVKAPSSKLQWFYEVKFLALQWQVLSQLGEYSFGHLFAPIISRMREYSFGHLFAPIISRIRIRLIMGANRHLKEYSLNCDNTYTILAIANNYGTCETFLLLYIVPFILNQCGSFLYYFALGSSDLTLAVPVANSLTFVATALCGWILGEEPPNKNTCIGILLVITGIVLCFLDKT